MSLRFRAYDAGDGTSGEWAAQARAAWPDLTANAVNPHVELTDDQARQVIDEYLPELVPVLDRLAGELDRPGATALLSHLTLKSPFTGCTQTSVEGALLRNYDFDAAMCDRTIVRSTFLRPVLGMNDVLWGLLDGVNDVLGSTARWTRSSTRCCGRRRTCRSTAASARCTRRSTGRPRAGSRTCGPTNGSSSR